MPYFHSDKVNLLLIHIPKTGGTSLEQYFSEKYNIPLNDKSLFNVKTRFEGISLQHQTYLTLKNKSEYFKIDFNGLKKITIVRNPYERLISDLFFYNLITKNTSVEDVDKIIKMYIYGGVKYTKDNHVIPQYLFLINESGEIEKDIIILKQENLNECMINQGYTDFNIHLNVINNKKIDYYTFLSPNSIKLINKYYEKDFSYFNYKMR